MLTSSEKEELKKKLQNVGTAQDLFDFLSANYDLKSVELGIITKPVMIKGAIDIINALNPKKKFRS
jgi:hypothetical protein